MANEINITMTAKDLASGKIKGVGDQAKTSMDKLRGMRGSFLAVGAAGGAVIGALGLAIKSFAQTGDEIQKMAFRTALSTEVLSEYKFALEQSGSSIDGFEKAIKRMSSFVLDGRDGLTTTTDALDRLGISILDLEGLGVEDAFVLLSSALSNVEDDITQAALAQDVFGRAGTALLPLLAQGADGIAALREEAHALGIVFTQDMADSAADVIDAQNTLKKSVLGLQFAFAEHLVPALTSTLEFMGKVISKVTDFAKENPALTATIGALAAVFGILAIGIAAVGLALPLAAIAFTSLGIGVSGAALAFVGFNLATGGILLAIGLVVAGIVALIMNWDAVVHAVKVGVNFMIDAIEMWVNVHIKAFNKIIDGLNLVAGVFGKQIDQIAEVELPRINIAMEKVGEVVEEETESVSKSLETVQDEFVKTADEAEESSKRIAATLEKRGDALQKLADQAARVRQNTWDDEQATKQRERDNKEKEKARDTKLRADEMGELHKRGDELQELADEESRIRQNTFKFEQELRALDRKKKEEDAREQEEWEKREESRIRDNRRKNREKKEKEAEAQAKNDRDFAEAQAQSDRDLAEGQAKLDRDLAEGQEQVDRDFAKRKAERKKEQAKLDRDLWEEEKALAEEREEAQAQELARDLEDAATRADAVKFLQDENRAAFDALRESVNLLPSVIPSGGIGSAAAPGANVMQLFKNSQQAVLDDLKAARAALAAGQAGMLGGGTTVAMLEAEVAKLEGIEASGQFKGGDLGALLAPVGGYGTGGPPMLPGMKFKEGVPGVVTTIIFNGDTYGLDDFTDKVNQGITEAAQRGALMPDWSDTGEGGW